MQYKKGESIGGEFTVLEVFGGEGRSGMGVVYLVSNREARKPFVLKTHQQSDDASVNRQFLSEAHAWVKAGAHPSIVQAYWVREIAGRPFVAAEYIAPDEVGRNNLTHFLSDTPLRIESVLAWAAQFSKGMAYAMGKGVLAHRDIKPDNLMIDRDGILKITDFGLARALDATAQPNAQRWWQIGRKQPVKTVANTVAGSVMGTIPYMSPEQFLDSRSADHRSDIYAFGVVLYQVVSGNRYPYHIAQECQDIAAEFFRAHSAQAPIPVASPLMPIISKCLAKQPAHRYPTYDAFLNDLELLASKLDIKLPALHTVAREDEELYAQAQSYMVLGKPDLALSAIAKYVNNYPENECGWTEKGRIHRERNEIALGISATRRSLSLNPYNTHAWNNLGIMLFKNHSPFQEVVEAYEKALYFDPLNTAAMLNYVGALVAESSFSKAAALVGRAVTLAPTKPLALAKAAAVLKLCFEHKMMQDAKNLLLAWTGAVPSDANAWHNLALVFLDSNDLERSYTSFKKSFELDPSNTFALTQLAKLSFRTRKAKDCLRYCDELLNRRSDMTVALSTKAAILNIGAGYEAALAFLHPYLKGNESNDALWMILADIHADNHNHDAAIQSLEKARLLLEASVGAHKNDNLEVVESKMRDVVNAQNEMSAWKSTEEALKRVEKLIVELVNQGPDDPALSAKVQALRESVERDAGQNVEYVRQRLDDLLESLGIGFPSDERRGAN